ncbi:MAG: endonuclease/exonuclease/phosphatase family protein [Verrucomicrobiales bacterium]|nr:endonuclease/exonuclease/phosphatase family protein [Verrucomicrobiales bacterium]
MWRLIKKLLSFLVPAVVLLAYAGLWICKFNQWDSLTFITVIPFWMWAMPGILISVIAALLVRSRFSYVVLAIWALTALFASAETRGLFRSAVGNRSASLSAKKSKGLIKLISINCRSGNLQAAQEAIELKPDLVLLQEAPDREDIEELTRRLFGELGHFVAANGTAIIGKGDFLTFAEDDTTPTIHARFKHSSGVLIDLSSVKLEESIPEAEFWKLPVREKMAANRVKNRKSLRKYIGHYRPNAGQPIRIVGGDFATPPGDDIFRPLRKAGLRDAFDNSGRGTGNTFPAKFPIFRLDQIWISPEAQLLKTYTHRTSHSDRQIVICEFIAPL